MDVSERFGENLLRVRQARKLSQDSVSERARISRTQISLIENGQRQPRIETAIKLAGALDVPIEALFEGILWEPFAVGVEGRFRIVGPPELPRLSSGGT